MASAATIKPTSKPILAYYETLKTYSAQQVDHETAVRSAFQNLLAETARAHGWTLIPELSLAVNGATIRPDGTLRDDFHLRRGYWEAKDTADRLKDEIRKKIALGYPLSNMIFEDTRTAILYQGGKEAFSVDLSKPADLAALLNAFYSYTEPDIENFDQAVTEFQEQVPNLAQGLNDKIRQAHKDNKRFQSAYAAFFELCRTALNPNLSRDAVDKMLVQHLLTERLIRKIFDNPDFMNNNAIAADIEKVIRALVSSSFSREDYLRSLDRFYKAIEDAAHGLHDFSDKQHFLNSVYERFFQSFDRKVADTHGIVYTPQPIVDFMCESVIEALQTEFGKTLGDPDVVILDPATGTGNFIVNLLQRIPKRDLEHAYRERLFANEVMLLPYYVAALNIEHAYYELTGQYEPFEGLCFVDTLDMAEGAQMSFSFMTEANTARVERQKKAPITVIIGNPPYNVGQVNENDNNKNRKYDVIDGRIAETYARDSKAILKAQLYDAYVKFFRWATDRLQGRDGIVCYVSNNSFVDQIAFDGMRKHLWQDFTRIYHIDLHGNVRKNPKLSGSTHNVFGIQVGVGITVAIRSAAHTERSLYYHRVPEDWRKEEKLGWLAEGTPHHKTPNPQPLPPISGEGERNQPVPPMEGEKEGEWNPAMWQTDGKLWGKLRPLAREKRNNPTLAEDTLWQRIHRSQLGPKFRRQFSIERFIVDFYSSDAKLVIEVDGEIHRYTALEDEIRQRFLEDQGLRVLRFTNDEVLTNIDQVLKRIQSALHSSPPSPEIGGRGRGLGVNLSKHIPWQLLEPDNHHTWLIPERADQYAVYLPMGSKLARGKSSSTSDSIFKVHSPGIMSGRDSLVYSFNREILSNRIERFCDYYNAEIDRFKRKGQGQKVDDFVNYSEIKWSNTLKNHLKQGVYAEYDPSGLRKALYRPFSHQYLYYNALLIDRPALFPRIFPTPATEQENRVIWVKVGSEWPMFALMSNHIMDWLPAGGSQCFPYYTYDEDGSNRRENITDWALRQFREHYADPAIGKWDIFYYVYGMLHHPGYREKFADNLKRELPRIPFAPEFRAFAEAGRKLADLHLHYETVKPYGLEWIEAKDKPLSYRVEKMRLSKDKSELVVNESLTLKGIPAEAFQYRLGNRSALEWVIDQYQVTTDKRSGITSDPNRDDEPRYIVDLVERVITVSLETVKVVGALGEAW